MKTGMSDRSLLCALVAVLLAPVLWAVYADPDLFWHVRTGQLVLETGQIPSTDPWSYTHTGSRWTDHEWLPDVLQASLWAALGSTGLLLLRDVLLAVAVIALTLLCWRRWPSPAVLAVTLASSMPLLAGFLNTRPHSFTYALLPLLFLILDRARDRPAWLWALTPLLIAWVNLHGGFVLGWGVALLGIASLAAGLERRPPIPHRLAAISAAGVALAPLCNPYGVELLLYVATEMTANHAHVPEWRPPTGVLWLLWGVAAAVPLAMLAMARRIPRATEGVTFLLVVVMSARHAKFLVLLVMVGTLVAFDALPAIWQRALARRPQLCRLTLSRAAALGLAGAIGLASFLGNLDLVTRHPLGVGLDRDRWPVQAIEWLRDNPTGPRVLTDMTWGNLALWHLTPDRMVAMDGRNTAVYDAAWVDRFLTAWVEGDLAGILDEHGADVLILPASGRLYERARVDPVWVLAFEDPISAVFVPPDRAPDSTLRLGTLPAVVEFPGP
jgi:hypothetical protein